MRDNAPSAQHPTPDAPYDLLVIGGGIIGSGIARDAALRGLRVALVEKEDFGAGTTSRSTRLIHGGLRYLAQWDIGLVSDDLRERERLLHNAPHLVRPLPFLLPLYQNGPLSPVKLRAGMLLYDLLSMGKSLPPHRMLSRAKTLALEPGLNADGLTGAALFYDAQIVSPERLCIENVIEAAAHGAAILNHTEVVRAILEGKRMVGVEARDTTTHAPKHPHTQTAFLARVTINASGPWFDALAGLLTGQESRRIRRTKGIHFAAPAVTKHAIVLFSQVDGRLFFLVPWLDHTLVGTTDTDFHGDPAETRATAEEVEYLLRDASRAIPEAPWDTIFFTHAGVRALVRSNDRRHPSAVSRKHLLIDHAAEGGPEGLISVLGGKITAYRSIAEGAVDLACRKLGRADRGTTAARPLPGGRIGECASFEAECQGRCAALGLSQDQGRHLAIVYGSRYTEVLEIAKARPELAAALHRCYPDIRAQVHHAVAHEYCRTVSDFLMRRSLLFFAPDQGRAALDAVLAEMAPLLGWDNASIAHERADYQRALGLSAVP